MSVTTRLATVPGWLRWTSFVEQTRDPEAGQRAVLERILAANGETAFGRRYEFSRLRGVAAFQDALPISDYEAHRPWIDRIQAGERAVLTADEPYMFSLTSGTTGAPKFVPVNGSSRRSVRQLSSMWLYRAGLQHAGLLDRRSLVVVSPAIEGHTSGGLPFGSSSGHIYQNAPWTLRRKYAVSYPVFTIKDFEAKYYCIMRFALEHRVSFLATPNPSTVLKLVETADLRRDTLVRDITGGTLDSSVDVPPEVRRQLTPHLRPNPGRARALAAMVERTGALAPKEYWPDLALIGCWKGGSVGATLGRLQSWFAPGVPFRDIGYLASEGQMTLPIQDNGCAGVLALDANFYEFIPEGEIEGYRGRSLTAWQLEPGASYYVLVTTPAGLYRYDMNDIVRVAGFFNRAPLLEFVRKGRDMVSLTGEKLHVGQLVQAVVAAQRATGVEAVYFRALGHPDSCRYSLELEFSQGPIADDAATRLGAAIDRELARLNIEYDQKRRSGRLAAPTVRVMARGWSARRIQGKIAARGRDVQFKDALLALAGDDEDTPEVIKELGGGEGVPPARSPEASLPQ